MDFGSVQYLQAQLFPVCPLTPAQPAATNGGRGFLGSFLSKGLRTNQLEVNTDEKTLRQIARLKEPRDLFALPKDKDHDCPQQAPRWPIECQVIDERIVHIPYVPPLPERLNQTTGNELKPRPVGEENGIVVFNYNPISAVNYDSAPRKNSKKRGGSSDSDASSSESRGSSPERLKDPMNATFAKYFEALHSRSTSHSTDDYDDDEAATAASGSLDVTPTNGDRAAPYANGQTADPEANDAIEDIWANKSPEYNAATPTYIRSQFGKGSARVNGAIPPVRLSSECMNRVKLGRSPQAKLKESAATKGKGISSTPTISTATTTTSSSTNKFSTITASTTSSPIKYTTKAHATKKQSSSTSSLSDADGNECDRDRGADVLVAINPKKRLSGGSCKGQAKSKTDTPADPEGRAADWTSGPNARDKDNDDDDDDEDENEDENEDEFADESPSNDNENLPQFSRSAVGGSKLLTNCHPFQNDDTYDGLEFESRFESGNLAKAVMITQTYYELYLRPDLYTSRSKQWFYFRVRKTKKNVIYRFSIVNLVKSDSLYNEGMRPLMYSTINATNIFEGWRRCGENIAYYRNEEEGASGDDDEENSSFTLTFNVEFPNDDDTVYFAHSYPYTYSELQDYLMSIQKHPVKSKFCKLRLLCRSLAGNNVYYLTVTAPTNDEEAMKRKKAIVVSGRVHPSETPSSWMMKGLMDFITGDTMVAKRLRHKFIFKLIPMLNPDGVIVGNTRNSLTGKDLNRQYRTVIRETYPSIWYTKAMIKRLIDECGVAMYCDMHAHSRKHNIFIYGCENKRVPEKKLTEQVFPLMMHKNVADKFSFESCKFKIQRSKEGTGRIVVWMLGITNSYTLEASFGGSTLASRKGTHYTTADYEHIGRAFCETLLDYGDENPTKERLRLKIIERLLKEGSSAEEPLNIPLSDYSSDEGDTSISSENEGKNSIRLSDLEGPCCAPTKAPPSSPEVTTEMRKFRINRMRKIMFELDRLYFQPLLHLRFRTALRKRARRKRPAKPNHPSATRLEGGEDGGKAEGTETTHQSSASEPSEPEVTEETNMSVLAETLMGLNAEALGMKLSCVAVKPAKAEVQPQPSNTSMTCPSTETITPPAAPNKKSTTCRRKRKGRKARDATAGNDGADASEGKSNKKRVSRPLRLFLAARKIIIYRRRKQRKFRVRSKSSQSKRNRTPIDLPTTDPGSDLHFSTDDEMPLDTLHSIYSTVPRTRRILLQSELQRRYIEEIGDGLETKFMPPELIITTPNKVNHQKHRPPPQIRFTLQPPPQTAPQQAKETLMEFPLIGNPTPRRTNSWHNLHTKSMAKSKVQSPYQWLETNNQEELAMKLSLKKKIWTGVHPDNGNGNGPGVDRSRPLSWLMPPQMAEQQHSATRTTCFVKRERTIISSGHLAHGRDPALDLFNACSQKLMAWQKEVPNSPRDHLILSLPTPDRETVGSGLRSSTSKQAVHLKKKNADKPPNRQLPLDSNNATDTVPAKLKRKKNPLTKIAETTQILSRLAKTTSSSTMQRQTKSGVSVAPHIRSATAGYTLGYNNNNNNKLPNAPSQSATTNKFKTGGIVATAVQPSTKRRKKLRSLAVKKQDCSQLATAAAPLKAKASAAATTTNALQLKGAVSSSSFMRKVKSKIKRKKSNTAALNEGSGSGVGGGGGLVTSGSHTTHDFRRSSTTTTTTMTIEMMTRKMKELPYM